MEQRIMEFLKEIAISNDNCVTPDYKARAFDLAIWWAKGSMYYRIGEFELPEEKFRPIQEALQATKKIEAIKLLREATKRGDTVIGLKVAKVCIEDFMKLGCPEERA